MGTYAHHRAGFIRAGIKPFLLVDARDPFHQSGRSDSRQRRVSQRPQVPDGTLQMMRNPRAVALPGLHRRGGNADERANQNPPWAGFRQATPNSLPGLVGLPRVALLEQPPTQKIIRMRFKVFFGNRQTRGDHRRRPGVVARGMGDACQWTRTTTRVWSSSGCLPPECSLRSSNTLATCLPMSGSGGRNAWSSRLSPNELPATPGASTMPSV